MRLKMEKTSRICAFALGTLATLCGCVDTSNFVIKDGKVDNYEARIGIDGAGRHIVIYGDKRFSEGRLSAVDSDNDGRFDNISLIDLPKGHPLEDYTSVTKLEEAYDNFIEEQ